MRLVLDASVALAWFLPETQENTKLADRVADLLMEPAGLALVPVVFNLECAIALRRERNRGSLSESALQQALNVLEQLPLEVHDVLHSTRGILRLASEYQLHPSDALYVELAASRRVPLATLDETVRTLCRRKGLDLI